MKHSEINQSKWDACIQADPLGLPYAYAWYLDAATEQKWDALTWNNYEFVMPLPWNKKWSFKQIYQPHPCQQLGVFGSNLSPDVVTSFLSEYTRLFKFSHQAFKNNNTIANGLKRNNFILNLDKSYEKLFAAYRKDRRKTIRKAKERGEIKPISAEVFWTFYKQHDPVKLNKGKGNLASFQRVLHAAIEQKRAIVIGYYSGDELEAVNAYTKTDKRIVSLLGTVNPKKRSNGGGALVFDAIIEQYAGSGLLFDFEGSMIPEVAYFIEGFSPQEEAYFYMEKQPALVKTLKKLIGR